MSEPKNSSTTSVVIPATRQPLASQIEVESRLPGRAERQAQLADLADRRRRVDGGMGCFDHALLDDYLKVGNGWREPARGALLHAAEYDYTAMRRAMEEARRLAGFDDLHRYNITGTDRISRAVALDRLVDVPIYRPLTISMHQARRATADPAFAADLRQQARNARRRASRQAAILAEVTDAVRMATLDWSTRRTTVEAGPASVWYEHVAEWATRGYCKRHNFPAAVYDVLHVRAPLGVMPAFDRPGSRCREITIGPWTWRKLRGHSLAVRYQSQGPEADRAEFAATANTEMRAAITVASGDHVESLLDARLLQADDYGRLYQTAVGRMVRVVCPSTGRTHWLRAEPGAETAHAAVAASFGMSVIEYAPQEQH